MVRYDADVDLDNPNNSHTQVIDLVGHDRAVLDVGCSTGYLARQLATRGCIVSGLELDVVAAEQARPDLQQLVIADLNNERLSELFGPQRFDVIVFADVLEHLLEPQRVLEDSLSLLADGGRIVISIPNAAHGSVRLALLQGRWEYTDTGLLDHTHVRFFTRESLLEMFQKSGLVVDVLRATVADPLGVSVEVDADRIPSTVIEWVRHQPEALNYQFIISAHRPVRDEPAASRAVLVPAVSYDAVRSDDEYTQRMREEQVQRHRSLTMRDHLIGLESRVAAADQRLAEANVIMSRLQARVRRQVTELRTLRRLRQSATWRAGRIVTSPARIARKSRGTER